MPAQTQQLISELPENPTIDHFRRYDGTLYARNHSVNAVSCNTRDDQFLLAPAGHDGDCQVLPRRCLDEAGFQKVINKGQVSISNSEAYAQYSMEGSYRLDEERQSKMDEIKAMTEESSSSKDLVEMKCLISGDMVFQTQADIDAMVPPLAPNFKHRESEFYGTPVQQTDGSIKVVFNRLPGHQ